MKKIVLGSLALLLLLLLAACGSGDETSGESEEKKVLKVGATGQSYPNAYKEEDKLVGFDVEVIETAAKNMGYEVEWTLADFSGIMGQLDSKRVDTVANDVAVTDERKEKYAFTDPYSKSGTQLATAKDNNKINEVADFTGGTIAGVLGSNHIEKLTAYDADKNFEIRTYETREGAKNDAVLGRVEGYVSSKAVLLAETKNRDLELKLVGDPVAEYVVAFPFLKENEELKNLLNDELAKLKEDGTLAKISEKYFGDNIIAE
ncbi:transporter substrate-binding domain-containing protein [Planococcus sp. 1R117A]|uniref:transporter substrate-binding domain-containing protein n=1 Tax=Planococcus sp. 1R117A TaxID=3447020 RepID=UPI003EDC432A